MEKREDKRGSPMGVKAWYSTRDSREESTFDTYFYISDAQ